MLTTAAHTPLGTSEQNALHHVLILTPKFQETIAAPSVAVNYQLSPNVCRAFAAVLYPVTLKFQLIVVSTVVVPYHKGLKVYSVTTNAMVRPPTVIPAPVVISYHLGPKVYSATTIAWIRPLIAAPVAILYHLDPTV